MTQTEGEGTAHGGQGASKPSPRGCPLVALRSYLGNQGRTWERVGQGGETCGEKGVRCESGRVAWGPAGTLPCVSDDRADIAV